MRDISQSEVAGTRLRAPEQAPVMKSTAGSSGVTFVKKLTLLERRQVRAAPGLQLDIAKEFGVSPNYVCMLKSGQRQIPFTPVEVVSATLTSLAFAGEA
jgi:hypothetical protein